MWLRTELDHQHDVDYQKNVKKEERRDGLKGGVKQRNVS
jgi:hypothetical protein